MVGFGLLLLMPSRAPRGGARREWCSSTEPTTGLDPQSRANLWTHIRSLRDELGVTVQLRTHYLAKAGALADRILVMDGGLVVADDTPDALKARIAGDVVTLQLGGATDAQAAQTAASQVVRAREVTCAGNTVRVSVDDGGVAVAPLLRAMDAAGLSLTSVAVTRPTLDDVFLTLTGRSLREDAEAAVPHQDATGPATQGV